jgi:hypothetical protein
MLGCEVKRAGSTEKEKLLVFVLFYGFVQVLQPERLIAMSSTSLNLLHLRYYVRYCVGDRYLGECTKYVLLFTTSFLCSHFS